MAFTSLIKDMNERLLVECMRDGRMYTRQELALAAGVSFPTAGKLVDELAERGMLVSLGVQENSLGGRRAEQFRMDGDFAHVLALFLQGSSVCYAAYDALGKRISRQERRRKEGQSTVMLMEDIIRRAREQDGRITAVAAGVPGGVHAGVVCYIDGYEELKGRPLEKELTERTGLPVQVSNNMNALAFGLAEKRGRQEENLVCIHLAENGPGCGAVVNGKPVNGFCGFNGEIGFMPLFGDKTLQDVALGGFAGVSPGEYMGKMITCICTLLNPKEVILYLEQNWENPREEIEAGCGRFLPPAAVPELVFADSYREDYLYGLMALGTKMLFDGGRKS